MKLIKSRFLKLTLIVVFVLAVILAVIGGNNPLQRAIYTVFSPVNSYVSRVVIPVREFFVHMSRANEYEKKIEQLESEITTLKVTNKTREDYIEENKRLKELLDLKEGKPELDTISARVVSYEPDSWYDTVMLDKGTNAGIGVNDIVITPLGLAGKVISVGNNWAKVSTIIDVANSVGVKLSRTGDIGVVSGDASLSVDRFCKLEYLSNDKNLIKGDILLSSGLGGLYPSDLPVGKVTEIISDSAGNLEYGIIEPFVDFSALYEVLVIRYGEEIEE
ncbi:MAG: rod shape-determining protein MreC [Ruminococcaceae bacterium]|nr:rod shape-determining protein MreC [Oscillospiraceae bacterium]